MSSADVEEPTGAAEPVDAGAPTGTAGPIDTLGRTDASGPTDIAAPVRRRLISASLVSSLGDGIYVPLTMLFVHTLTGLSLTAIGAGLTTAGLCALAVMPVVGVAVDRYGARPVVVASLVLRAVGFAGYLVADSYPAFLAVALVVAVGMWASSPSQQALIGEVAEGAARDRLLAWDRSLRNGGMGAGSLAAAGLLAVGGSTGFLAAAVTLAVLFALAAALAAGIPTVRCESAPADAADAPGVPDAAGVGSRRGAGAAAVRGVRDGRGMAGGRGAGNGRGTADGLDSESGQGAGAGRGSEDAQGARRGAGVRGKQGYRQVLADRPYLLITLANFLIAFGYTTQAMALPVYLTRDVGLPDALAGAVFALNTVLVAVLGVPVARLTLRGSRPRTAALGAAVFALSFVAFAVLPHLVSGAYALAATLAVAVLYTAGELVHSGPAQTLSVQAAPDRLRGRYLSVYQLSWSLCRTVAPLLLGLLLEAGSWQLWAVLALLVLSGAVALLCAGPGLPPHASVGGAAPVAAGGAEHRQATRPEPVRERPRARS
ncbi:MFS transporter [Streptomyces sp. HSW2009]|uniref:MFS transporter n=1 Tax=Streptomyces sp. HSW2009 TaxID=3142890 RepID=UPI0032EC1794